MSIQDKASMQVVKLPIFTMKYCVFYIIYAIGTRGELTERGGELRERGGELQNKLAGIFLKRGIAIHSFFAFFIKLITYFCISPI